MSQKAVFSQIIEDLQKVYGVQFSTDPKKEVAGRLRALEECKRKNLELIQEHFEEILVLINHKRPCIEMLEILNRELEQRIDELKKQQSDSIRMGA